MPPAFFIKNRYRWPVLLALGAVLIVSRRPDMLAYPQFWAEDGTRWYFDAYALGPWASLAQPHSGYFQTISRLTASVAIFLPLALAPLFFNCVAIFFRVLPALFVLSPRFDGLMPKASTKALAAITLIGLPNIAEVHANATNSQWHMALLAGLILIADAPAGRAWKIFDAAALTLSGLSGPCVLILAPFALLRAFMTGRWSPIRPIAVTAVLQGAALLNTIGTARFHQELGASPGSFIEILTGQIFVASIGGQDGFSWLVRHDLWQTWFIALVFSLCLPLVLYAFRTADARLKTFWAFCFATFAAGLLQPAASMTRPQWDIMMQPGSAGRYWLLPMVAFLGMLFWLARRQTRPLPRLAATALLTLLPIGIIANWRLPVWQDLGFREQTAKFEAGGAGAYEFKIQPEGWTMTLQKR